MLVREQPEAQSEYLQWRPACKDCQQASASPTEDSTVLVKAMALHVITTKKQPTFAPILLFQTFYPGNMPPSANRPAAELADEPPTGSI